MVGGGGSLARRMATLSGCHVKGVQFAGMWKELFSQGLGKTLSQRSCDDSHFPRVFRVEDTLDI